jgi:hypothetical protein
MTETTELLNKGSLTDKVELPEPRIATEVVERITAPQRHPGYDETRKATLYYISYVTTGGTAVTKECTKEVADWNLQSQPEYDVHAAFILNINLDNQQVIGVVRKPHLRNGPLSTRLNIDPNFLILQKSGNNYEPINLPLRFSSPVLQEAIQALNAAGHVRPGNKLGKFVVKNVLASEVEDADLVVLDILPD